MQHVFVRCMDGCSFPVSDNPCCPLDGSRSDASRTSLVDGPPALPTEMLRTRVDR